MSNDKYSEKSNITQDDLKKINAKIDSLPPERKVIAKRISKELTFLRDTLVKLKKEVEEHGVIVEGVRGGKYENPALKSYNTTLQRYSVLYKQLDDLFPRQPDDTPKDELLEFMQVGFDDYE